MRTAWLYLLPMLVVLGLVAGWPLARTIWFGFTNANLTNLEGAHFVGFANYLTDYQGHWYGLLVDPAWWRSVGNTLYFAALSVTLETVLGTLMALVLNTAFTGRALVRAAVLIPWAIPTVVSARLWGWLLNDQYGVINHLLLGVGLISQPLAWTAAPDLAMTSVIIADVWKTTPFVALLVLAALQMLPLDCYEAARIDGVHPVKVFFQITLPLIRPALLVAVVFRLLDALRIFDLVYVLTSNSPETMTMSVYVRQQLVDFQEVGYGSAAATLLFFIIALCTALYLTAARVRFDPEDAG